MVEGPAIPAASPRAEYARRLAEARAIEARESRRDRALADARLAVFLATVGLIWLIYRYQMTPWWLLVPLAGFAGLVVVHGRVARAWSRVRRAAEYYEGGRGGGDERWAGRGEPGTRYLDEAHPYAADLDLFGKGSLYERLCTARTRAGQDVLAAWLLAPAAPEEVQARQEAVAELRPRLDLREDLALLGEEVRVGLHPEALVAWGAAAPVLDSPGERALALLLAVVAAASLVGWLGFGIGRTVFVLTLAVEIVFALRLRGRVRWVVGALEEKASELALLGELLGRLERERFATERLRRLRALLEAAGAAPSRRIGALARWAGRLEMSRNQLFLPIALILLWDAQIAFAVERWRRAHGSAIARWMAAVGEIEALSALAGYAYENPDDPFPKVEPGPACFEGEGLGHPLLPLAVLVRNDVRLAGELRMLVVSGSNMSGKSTLLRTVGVNAVLALAGAPVRATRLRLSTLAVGATLRIQDSLQQGRSRFYAEITRVRQLVDQARSSPPLLFLLDEIFNGTNSHDRRVGAEAVVRRLIDLGAIGLVTTHDLALTEIADRLAPRAANVHFEDRLEDGQMIFDYRMRPGVVTHSNALALMRAVGLEV
ncbi:MAG: DNA mismatch repair protein MutS [Isosphaeraceae bacterium]|nr:DNA mismatch repair protein MutS [Isosphaeraceae bacterium]